MNKKLIISLSTIAAIAIIAIGATTAYFSNTEKSEGNTFIAGAIDLKVDNKCHYNGQIVDECTWQTPIDLKGKALFSFNDIKPGDHGEDTISLHVDTNPAWVCAEISNVTNKENGCNSPEAKVDNATTSCGNPGEGQGELLQNLLFSIWMDNGSGTNACNNVKDTDENYLVQNAPATDLKYPIADSVTGGQPIQDACIGVAWNVPSGVGNEIQGDSVTGDITFKAYQSRNNTPFYCYPVCSNGRIEANEQCDNGANNGQTCSPPYGGSCDYCSNECKIVTLYGGYCGNGILENGEQCDDGNTESGDGCSSACQKECFDQADVMLVLDRSGSINSTELGQLKTAANAFITAMNPDGGVHMGQTSFSTNGSLDLHLTGNATSIKAAINGLTTGGYTNLYEGILLADQELDGTASGSNERPSVPDYMVIITDGRPNRPSPETNARTMAANAASTAKGKGVTIYVVGVGSDVDSTYLKNQIATSPSHYFGIGSYGELENILQAIATCQTPQLPPVPETIFSDDFNDGNYDGWSIAHFETPDGGTPASDISVLSGTDAYEGYSIRMEDDAGIYRTISTINYKDINVAYCRRTQSVSTGDLLRFGWKTGVGSANFGDYNELEAVLNNTWTCVNFNLPALANNTSISIASYLDNGEGDYGWLDNVVVSGIPLP